MTLSESIDTCFRKYATFKGRASRSEFWWWALFTLLGQVVLGMIHEKLGLGFAVATLLPYLAVTARRLHDTNRGGWHQLIGLVPFVGLIVLIYWLTKAPVEPNRFTD